MTGKSFGEYKCMAESLDESATDYVATFRIGKRKPDYAEIVGIIRPNYAGYSDYVFKIKKIVKRVTMADVRTWPDFVDICKRLSEEQGFALREGLWSFTCSF